MEQMIAKAVQMLSEGRERYDRAALMQCAAFRFEPLERQPLLLSASLYGRQLDFPSYNSLEVHNDHEKMMLDGLRHALESMNGGREAVPSLRANMGCGIVPALFGVLPRLFEDKMPWVREHLPKSRLKEMTAGDIRVTPEFQTALDHMDYMRERLKDSGVRLFPVDIQGAFDTAHIVLGDSIFYEIYDDPDFVHHLLDLSCHAIALALKECRARMPDSEREMPHYNALVMPRDRGGLKLSEDTSTLLNKEQIAEFVTPYMHRALKEAGGGYIHYCGHNPHLYEAVMNEPLAYALNFGNPEKHDMAQVLKDCAARGKLYYGSVAQKNGGLLDIPEITRLLRASRGRGRLHLLLTHHCKYEQVKSVSEAWDEAVARALSID